MKKNWKTTLAGLIAGLPIGISAISDASAAGSFNGKTGLQLLAAIALVLMGAFSKDSNVTGGTKQQ